MYTIYIHDDETPKTCIYDRRSPSEELRAYNITCNLEDSRAGSISFTLPPDHIAYDILKKNKTIVSMYRLESPVTGTNYLSEKLIFEGPIRKLEDDFYENKKVYAEGFFSFLNESVQPEKEYFNCTLEEFMRGMIAHHNERMIAKGDTHKTFWIGTVEVNYPDKGGRSEFEGTQFGSTMDYFLAIQKNFGGHFIFTKIDTEVAMYLIDYRKELSKNEDQCIRFGENFLDYANEEDSSEICTCAVPVSKVSKTSFGMAGDTLACSDLTKPVARGTWVDVITDDQGRDLTNQWAKALVLDPNGSTTDIYNGDTGNVLAYYYPRRLLEQDPNDDTKGMYQISDATWGTNYYVLRYFTTYKDERLYISCRHYVSSRKGLWCLYAYNNSGGSHGNDVIAYQGWDGSEVQGDYRTVIDYELDMSYTESGQEIYMSRENQNPKSVGELLLSGVSYVYWDGQSQVIDPLSTVPCEVKRAKYSYSKNPERGTEIPMTFWEDCILMKNSGSGTPTKYMPISASGIAEDHFGVMAVVIPEDVEGVLIATRTKNAGFPREGYEAYTSDCLWALYMGAPNTTVSDITELWLMNHAQINHSKLDNTLFTSRIDEYIDLTAAENKGGNVLLISEWSLRGPNESNPGSALLIPKLYRRKKYADKMENYLTVDGALPTDRHEEGSIYVMDEDLIGKYGYIEKRLEFNGIEDSNVLVKRAEAHLTDVQFGDKTVTIKGVDLHDLNMDNQAFDISTKVCVNSYVHGIDKYFDLLSITIDPDRPGSNQYSFSESNEGHYEGKLPCSILTTTQELANFVIFGTKNGLTGSTSGHDAYITITVTNLMLDDQDPDKERTYTIERNTPLTLPDSESVTIDGFAVGLIDITVDAKDSETGERPKVSFDYTKYRE